MAGHYSSEYLTDRDDVGDTKEIDSADVYKAGQLAGQLRRDRDDVVFTYTDNYRTDSTMPAVAFTLPKSVRPYRSTGGSVPAFFAGLLPEGLRLHAMSTAVKTSEDDHFSILLAVGADTIGDVQIVPAGSPPRDPPALTDDTDTADADFAALFARAVCPDVNLLDKTALAGAQVKVSARMISTPITRARGPAILKLAAPEHPYLLENENFFLDIAHGCGIQVPEHQLATDRAGRTALFVTRFDRVAQPGSLVRLAQEDACQVLGRYPAAKYRISLQQAIIGLADAVESRGCSRSDTALRLLEIAAFSYLIGNGDLHGKNLSIRQNPDGIWEATPAYDLLTTQPYLGWRDPMALSLYGRNNKLRHRYWIEAAVQLGIPAETMAMSLARIVTAAQPWIDRVPTIGFDDRTTERLAAMLRDRSNELLPTT